MSAFLSLVFYRWKRFLRDDVVTDHLKGKHPKTLVQLH